MKNRVKNGGHDVPEADIVRRYYKSITKFWDKYRFMSDEWTLFYNGYDYAPIIVSFGMKDTYETINNEMFHKFKQILNIAREETNDK